MTMKQLSYFLLLFFISQQGWAATPDSVANRPPTINPMPKSGIILTSGILPTNNGYLVCGGARAGSTSGDL